MSQGPGEIEFDWRKSDMTVSSVIDAHVPLANTGEDGIHVLDSEKEPARSADGIHVLESEEGARALRGLLRSSSRGCVRATRLQRVKFEGI